MATTEAVPDEGGCETVEKGSVLEEFKEIDEIIGLINNLKNVYNDDIAVEILLERFNFVIDEYQEQPHLIDPHLEVLMGLIINIFKDEKLPPQVCHLASKCMYLITKMRGFKVVVRYFPHEVTDMEIVLKLLSQQDPKDPQTWESRYILLLWLSMVCMIPFDMVRLDSNVAMETGNKREPVMDRVINISKTYLMVNDKCRDAAAYLASKFLNRPDIKKRHLPGYLDWALTILDESENETMEGMRNLTGVLTMLALLFKHGKREDLLEFAPVVLKKVDSLNLSDSGNSVIRKTGIKVVQRIGLIFLKARVASWRYQRGSRSLAENLQTDKQTNNNAKNQSEEEEEDEEEYDIPEELEEIIEQLLTGLKDKDTIVRWSAAKGIGRITGRLPKELADEVVGSVLDLFSRQESDGAWHGGCLALAELGRRGLLVPERLPEVVPVVVQALEYDEKRGSYSVGANVRDSACYVCWAFARAYDPQEIQAYVKKIANALVKASIFDREINVRRAASAAFQENVGRQGTFPHGIDILTTADYFAVGNRTHCYLCLSAFVAQFQEYTISLIDHLVYIKTNHWDCNIRELTSQGLNKLSPLAPNYMVEKVLPYLIPLTTGIDLYQRHGAFLAVAQIVFGLSEFYSSQNKTMFEVLGAKIIDDIKNSVQKIQDAKMFRGLGGEYMRKAVCCLIEKVSTSKLPYHGAPILETFQAIIEDCLYHIEPDVRASAICAIPAFFEEYYRNKNGTAIQSIQEQLVEKFVRELKSDVEISRMSFALGIGAFPKFFLSGKVKVVMSGLIQCSKITEQNLKMADSRRDAVIALSQVCSTVGVQPKGDPRECVCPENIAEICDTLFLAMEDYTMDSKGDIGASVREAAMKAMMDLVELLMNTDVSLLSPEICKQFVCSLLQQACEKIDRTRAHAGNIFKSVLYHQPEVPHIPHRQELQQIFPSKDMEEINWGSPSDTFPRFTQLLNLKAYKYNVLLGLTVSVGGLTESLVIHSSQSLYSYLRTISKNKQALRDFLEDVLLLFERHIKVDRVSIPMLKMLDQLLSRGCFDALIQEESNDLVLRLVDLVKQEISRSGDPIKIMAGAVVYSGLLCFEGTSRKKCLSQLVILLCHKYPRIRKSTANILYEALVTYDDVIPEESSEEAMTIISETMWDDGNINDLRQTRNNLCSLMEVPQPKLISKVAQ